MSRYVRIYYGPYEAFYNFSHKPQKLKGLKDCLLRLGYRVDLLPVACPNHCVLEMQNREIFRCNLRNLKFNTPSTADVVCRRAVAAVLDASLRLQLADDYFWLRSMTAQLAEEATELRCGPKDYWIREDKTRCLCALERLSEAFE